MKAILQDKYGTPEDLRLAEVERPKIQGDDFLVRAHASSVHPDVWHSIYGHPTVLRAMGAGWKKPKQPIPGIDFAGEVAEVSSDDCEFKVGDRVYGVTYSANQWCNGGSFAEYVVGKSEQTVKIPENTSFEEVVGFATPGIIAIQNLAHFGEIRPEHHMLINGAAGAVGSVALQYVKSIGATVTAVDRGDRLESLRAMKADHLVDCTKEDFTESNERYDFIFDIPGNHSFSKCERVLKKDGEYIIVGHDCFRRDRNRWFGMIPRMLLLSLRAFFNSHLPSIWTLGSPKEALQKMNRLMEAGKLIPENDRIFPLEEVPQAIRYLESGEAQGRVIIRVC